ncbi:MULTISPECIES: hypothetical protein [unclassified Klebsiella]|uniref:hypothetical protein n=1 Tax=unclassified Klebsiella TaxID=2608929 RepID=UPI0021B0582C|nr:MULTISPECIES: hypothetical protein [unclassified Klebsiella]
MTKSTREQATDTEIQVLIDSHEKGTAMFVRTDAYYFMAKELQERRKAERDSEPVAYTDERNLGYIDRGRETAYLWGKQNSEVGDVSLYRHAQQPVVPEEMNFSAACNFVQINGMAKEDRVTLAMRVWNACRAAILQAQSDDDGEPTDDERIMAIEGIHNCERCGDEGWVMGEMGITRCACGQAGNSPVIPDGSASMLRRWLAFGRGMQNVGSQLPHNLIAETESMLAAAPQELK